jgi:hypothetical protein
MQKTETLRDAKQMRAPDTNATPGKAVLKRLSA